MVDIVRYRALEAFCRQRAQMEGEGRAFWLEEADILARLIIMESPLKILAASHEEEKGSQTWEPEFHQLFRRAINSLFSYHHFPLARPLST